MRVRSMALMIGVRTLRQTSREVIEARDLSEVIAAMGAGRPDQNRKAERQARRPRHLGEIGVGIETQNFRHATGRDAR